MYVISAYGLQTVSYKTVVAIWLEIEYDICWELICSFKKIPENRRKKHEYSDFRLEKEL